MRAGRDGNQADCLPSVPRDLGNNYRTQVWLQDKPVHNYRCSVAKGRNEGEGVYFVKSPASFSFLKIEGELLYSIMLLGVQHRDSQFLKVTLHLRLL